MYGLPATAYPFPDHPACLPVPLYSVTSFMARCPALVADGGMGGLGCALAPHIQSPFPGQYFRMSGEFRGIGFQAADQAGREMVPVTAEQAVEMVFVPAPLVVC